MEISEAVQRILRRHAWLILACLVAGLSVGFLVHQRDKTVYAASTRVVLDTADPKSGAESTAIADTARAIVTSPSHVAAALAKVSASRDPVALARHGVQVEALGTSGILDLTVTDTSADVASAVANALAADLIQTRLETTRQQLDQALADVNAQIESVDRSIGQLGSGNAGEPSLQRTNLDDERLALLSERGTILFSIASRPKPFVVDPAVPPSQPAPSGLAEELALGVLLGLVVGLATAALLETFNPTLIGRDAVARALNVPVLGELSGGPQSSPSANPEALLGRMSLAAAAAHVDSVRLVAPSPATDLVAIADWLQDKVVSNTGNGHTPGPSHWFPAIGTVGSARLDGDSQANGLVLVAPETVKLAALVPVTDLLAITKWPLLGVITHKAKDGLVHKGAKRRRGVRGEKR